MGIATVAINNLVALSLQSLSDRIAALEDASQTSAVDRATLDKAAALIAELESLAGATVDPAPAGDSVVLNGV